MVCRPARRKGRAQRWASVTAEPRAPLAGSSSGGSTSRTWRSPAGAPLRSRTRDRPPDERLRELARVPDRRRAADDDRMAAVVGADPKQPAQDVGDVPTEHAAVRVQLVDDDVAQLLEQQEPLGVVGEDRRVEHVRVGRDDLARGPDGRPDRRRRVAVVGRLPRRAAPAARGQLAELGDLVLAERLGREEEERAGGRVLGDGLQDRQRVAQRLARRGRRDHDHVLPGPGGLDRLGLVDVRPLDAAAGPGRRRCADRATSGSRRARRAGAAGPRGGRPPARATARPAGPSRTGPGSAGA